MKSKGSGTWPGSESLVLKKTGWRLLWLTMTFLIGYIILGELFFRIEAVQGQLTGPRIGSRHRQFEIQLARLDKLVREGEPIDCIFLGNSMIWLGVNPLLINQEFQNRTDREIHCFNFGVSALPASSAGQIATMLVERYHPKVLVYGTFARDYAVPLDVEDASAVSETPWLRYQNGDFNLQGWLYDHSALYQYKGHLHDFLLNIYLEDVFAQRDIPAYYSYGLDPKYDVRVDVREAPNPEDIVSQDPVRWLSHYEIQPGNVEGLNRITRLTTQGIDVIVIEMPFYKTAYEYFANGEQDYDLYIQQVDTNTGASHVHFWRLEDQPVLAPENWWDYFHLNLSGANTYSKWLGARLAALYLQGDLNLSSIHVP